MDEFRVQRSETVQPGRTPLMLAIVGVVLGLGALVWAFALQNRLAAAESKLADGQRQIDLTGARLAAADARARAASESLGQRLGITQGQIETRSRAILAQQQADTARLEKSNAAAEQKITAVSGDVSAVKGDVGAVRTDVASTRSDLDATKQQLQRTIGDAGVMSGLIARTHDELDVLKHKGDRTYYEFTLRKSDKPVLFAGVKISLRKLNQKKGRFTLLVSSDDRNIEKKDKTLDEPIQFYSGKTPALYEIVVNNMDKDAVTGYLSTPKA